MLSLQIYYKYWVQITGRFSYKALVKVYICNIVIMVEDPLNNSYVKCTHIKQVCDEQMWLGTVTRPHHIDPWHPWCQTSVSTGSRCSSSSRRRSSSSSSSDSPSWEARCFLKSELLVQISPQQGSHYVILFLPPPVRTLYQSSYTQQPTSQTPHSCIRSFFILVCWSPFLLNFTIPDPFYHSRSIVPFQILRCWATPAWSSSPSLSQSTRLSLTLQL